MNTSKKLAILVGGGPAPGINSVISSVTIEARKMGLSVIGVYDGFEHLIAGDLSFVRELTIEDVSRIHFQGGSLLRTARANPTKSEETINAVVESLRRLDVSYLVTIGGDDTAFAASTVARRAGGQFRVAHIPKTIDNDLPLPAGVPTFGYETARATGAQTILTLMEDSRTTNRWFVTVVMGRKAGHLALGIGKAAGATVTVIPEEFGGEKLSLDEIARVIEGSILKRRLTHQGYGMAIVAEGVGERLDPEELKDYAGVEVSYDPYGNVTLADIPLASLIKQAITRRFAARGDKVQITETTLGYELRCANPIPFDIDYTRSLGYGAVRFLLDTPSDDSLAIGGFVTLEDAHVNVLPFSALLDPDTGRTIVRLVDVESTHYRVARDYMIRLEKKDLDDEATCEALAAAAKLPVDEFRSQFAPMFDGVAAGV
ncbi:MAG: diphosphate--fructose-6-phosphate 1-phosphotransferase [Dehalococcoidia bacterium]